MSALLPRTKVPGLELATVAGDRWNLAAESPRTFTLLVFYRGHHCPLCKKQLQEIEAIHDEFEAAGIRVVAISSNPQDLAERTAKEWELNRLTLAYGLSFDEARKWGLFVSAAISDGEPAQFTEPGLFLVDPDGVLYGSIVQTMPFARPPAKNLLRVLEWVSSHDYPARGEVAEA